MSFAVSRVDLFADFQAWALRAEHRNGFVCRATNCTTFEEGTGFRGFQFGWRTTKTFSARVYDKTADVERHGSDWWFGLWGDGYVAGMPVHRVEFEIGRKVSPTSGSILQRMFFEPRATFGATPPRSG